MTTTEQPVPFWICPACGTFWSKVPMPSDPALRVNDGVHMCLDCKRAQWARDDERADAAFG